MQIEVPIPYVVEAEPAMEWLMDEPVQKVSPVYDHSFWQRKLAEELGNWGRLRGRTGSEWRFWIAPSFGPACYLVPDVAFVSFDRLPKGAPRDAIREPRLAPDVVLEILSPRDRNVLVQHKINVYLSGGTELVIVLDPEQRIVTLHDREYSLTIGETDIVTHRSMPGFVLALAPLFEEMDV